MNPNLDSPSQHTASVGPVRRWSLRVGACVATLVATLPLAAGPATADPVLDLGGNPLGVASGVLLDSKTGTPIVGAIVTYRQVGTRLTWRTFTDRTGHYRIAGVPFEEHAVHVWSPWRYESGYVGCPIKRYFPVQMWVKPVVPTWGAACSQSGRALGRIDVDRRF